MRILATIILAFSCLAAGGQISVPSTVPAATATSQGVVQPGSTMSIANGILDCIPINSVTYSAATGALVVNGVPVTSLTLQSATFNGVAAPVDGTYLTTFKSGVEGFTPYTPPSGGSGTTYTVSQPAQVAWAIVNYPIAGLTVAAGQVYSFSPNVTGAPSAWPSGLNYVTGRIIVNTAGQAWLQITNTTATTFPAMTWTVVVK